MSKCQLCSREVDEREIQEQIGFSLCLSCDCKYTDQELRIRLEFPNTSEGKHDRDLVLDNLFPRKENKFYKGEKI